MARILFFGALRDIAGDARETPLSGAATVGQLRGQLCASDPLLATALSSHTVRAAVDQVIAVESTPVFEHSEIAFMPPMSGG